jgi:glycosyltransferase involved in cell wall biosynthesis
VVSPFREWRGIGGPRGDARTGTDVVVVSYFNPSDVLGGAERIAWAEAEILGAARSVAFLSASAAVEDAPFTQYRIVPWTRRLYQPAGEMRNPFALAMFHLLSLFNPAAFVEALRLFKRLRPGVVHTHNLLAFSPAIWLAARLSGARVVHTHHDLWVLCERATMTDRYGRPCNEAQVTCLVCKALRLPKKAQLRLVSTEVFPSRWLCERTHRGGEVVPSFATTYREDAGQVGGPARSSTAAYVGALTPHKLGALLEAFELASEAADSSMRLAIAGSGPLADRVSRASETNPGIEYLGPLDSVARDALLAEAAVLVLPSTCAESSPLIFFEALAAGLPVIASDIGGITELERYGNLVLVPPGDAKALAQALGGLLADQDWMARLRAEARRHRADASPERFAGQIGGVLELSGWRPAS